jgi:hypothetical protein
MPKPQNQPELDLATLQPKTNLYIDSKVRFSKEVPMLLTNPEDGKQLFLPMLVLNPKEEHEIEARAYNDTMASFKTVPKKDEPGSDSWIKLMDDNRATWLLFYAVRLPNNLDKKFFLDKQQIESTYTPEEIGTLCNHYLDVKLNQPLYKAIDLSDPNAFQSIVDKIKSDAENSSFFLNSLTTHTVNQLVKFLVSQLQSLQNANGSSGEP